MALLCSAEALNGTPSGDPTGKVPTHLAALVSLSSQEDGEQDA